MRRLYLSEAAPGDVIAEPVVNERGMVILPKGAELTAPVIGRLQKMNVTDIVVEGDDPNAPPPRRSKNCSKIWMIAFKGSISTR